MPFPHKRDKIIEAVRLWLANGRYAPGDRFPSDQELARKFGVTHVTVRSALKPLVEEGLLERRIGWGTLVCVPGARRTPANGSLSAAVGVAIPDTTHSFFNEALRAIEAALQVLGRPLVLGHTWESPQREETVLRTWAEQGLARIIVAPSGGCAAVYSELMRQGVRLTFIDRDEPSIDAASVTTRDEAGAFEVASRLFAGERRRVWHLAGPARAFTAQARVAGFVRAQAAAGIKSSGSKVIEAGFFIEDGYRATTALLRRKGPPPDGILAANDPVAVGALRALAENGLEVPGDVRLAGYGDTDLARNFDLTSVRQFPDRAGAEAVRLLMSQTPATRQASVVLDPVVISRGSTT